MDSLAKSEQFDHKWMVWSRVNGLGMGKRFSYV